MIKLATLATAAVFAASSVSAIEFDLIPDRFGLTVLSDHHGSDGYFDKDGEYQTWTERNPGAYLSFDIDIIHSVTFSAFESSFGSFGAAATFDQTWLRGDGWDFGLYSGLAYYPDYGRYQVTSYGHLGSSFEDLFLVGGFLARAGNIEVRYTPAEQDSTSFMSLALVFDLGEPRETPGFLQLAHQQFGF